MKTKHLIAIGGGALAGVGAMMGLHLPFVIEGLIALAAAGSVGTGLTLVQSGTPSIDNSAKAMLERAEAYKALPNPNKLTPDQLESVNKAVSKIAAIRKSAEDIRAPHTARQVRKICDIGDKIVQDFRDDPSDIVHARTWLDVYLDQTLDLVQKYARLSKTGARSLEAQRVLGNVEQTFEVIEQQSNELLEKLLHNDITGLDVDQYVIRQMLENGDMK